ncbi:MAG: type II toxin-antitoxin system VapB family antitoxin [Acetobacteraceae bacterium]
MPLNIRSDEVSRLADELARRTHLSKTDAVKQALRNEFARLDRGRTALGPCAATLEAFSCYGKGQDHPARLNMGDCFAYAVAQNRGLPLLFAGNDCSHTDLG